MGKVEAIYLKSASEGPMNPVSEAPVEAGQGLVGNADRGGKRQITIIERERWQAVMEKLGSDLPLWTRRANLVVSGVTLEESKGRVVTIGACRIRIHGETRPCSLMDEAFPGLQEALKEHWGGGAFGEALDDATIRVGDEVRWTE